MDEKTEKNEERLKHIANAAKCTMRNPTTL